MKTQFQKGGYVKYLKQLDELYFPIENVQDSENKIAEEAIDVKIDKIKSECVSKVLIM